MSTSRYRGRTPAPPPNFAWALELRNKHSELFDLRTYLKNRTQFTHIVRSGQIWSALLPGTPVGLYSQRDPNLWCPGIVENGEWKPIPETPPGPIVLKLELVEHSGQAPTINPDHHRPGVILGDPHSNGLEGYASLLDYDRALWVSRWSKYVKNAHGQLAVPNSQGISKHYRFWTAWGISAVHGEDLLEQTEEDLPHGLSELGQPDLLQPSSRLMAEMMALYEWSGQSAAPRISKWPERGEIVQITFSPGAKASPCLVVSPKNLNRRNDLIVLRCIPYKDTHDEETTVVPLSKKLSYRGIHWSVDLTLVRGLAFAEEYWRFLDPRFIHSKDDLVMTEIHARLLELYA